MVAGSGNPIQTCDLTGEPRGEQGTALNLPLLWLGNIGVTMANDISEVLKKGYPIFITNISRQWN